MHCTDRNHFVIAYNRIIRYIRLGYNANSLYFQSIVPTGLSPPTLIVISPTSILISWSPPNSESAILFYEVTRNSSIIQEISVLQYTDNNLLPFTIYTYTITATNNAGSTESTSTTVRTSEDIPAGVAPVSVSNIQARSMLASWNAVSQPNGIITMYNVFTNSVDGDVLVFSGLAVSTTITSKFTDNF